MKKKDKKSSEGIKCLTIFFLFLSVILLVSALVVGVFFFREKTKSSKKKRANELNDEGYEYNSNSQTFDDNNNLIR